MRSTRRRSAAVAVLALAAAPMLLAACGKGIKGPLAQEPTSLTTYSPGPFIASPTPPVHPSATATPPLIPAFVPPTFGTPPTRRPHSSQPATHTSSPKPKPRSSTGTQPFVITAYDFYFDPQFPSVVVGTTVEFINRGTTAHTWTGGSAPLASGPFDSGSTDVGSSYTYTFNTPGTYNFFCQFHWPPPNGMQGSITVE
jgi:plastocyanin